MVDTRNGHCLAPSALLPAGRGARRDRHASRPPGRFRHALTRYLLPPVILLHVGAAIGSADETTLTPEQARRVRSVLLEFRRAETDRQRHHRAEELVRLGPPAIEMLADVLRAELDSLDKALRRTAPDPDRQKEAERLRGVLRELREDPKLTTEKIREVGDPAVAKLRQLNVAARASAAAGRAGSVAVVTRLESERSLLRNLCDGKTGGRNEEDEAHEDGDEDGDDDGAGNAPRDPTVRTRLEPLLKRVEELLDSAGSTADLESWRVVRENRELSAKLPREVGQAVEQLNEFRMLLGVPPLRIDVKLCQAADDHSADMVQHGFFSHESPVSGKRTFADRAKLAGTEAIAENIYLGSSDPRAALEGWYRSPPHHRNMLNEDHRHVGVGHRAKRWTLMFGE